MAQVLKNVTFLAVKNKKKIPNYIKVRDFLFIMNVLLISTVYERHHQLQRQ